MALRTLAIKRRAASASPQQPTLELRCYVAVMVGDSLDNAQSSEHNIDYSLDMKVDSLQTARLIANLLHCCNNLVQLVVDIH